MANASRLVLLSDLEQVDPGTKVRFLGCVERYDISTGTLHLRHRVEGQSTRLVTALVRVEPILESLKPELVDVGAWVNVIGYRRSVRRRRSSRIHGVAETDGYGLRVNVDAALVWSAGAIVVSEYEKSVGLFKEQMDIAH